MRSAMVNWIRAQLTNRIAAASFAVFRMAMGLLLFYDAQRKGLRFFAPNADRDFAFRFEYFHWLPEEAAWAHPLQLLWLMLSVMIVVGLFYRLSCILVTLLLIYGFLLGEEYYLNHYYLLIIVTLMMSIIPMHRTWSVDAALFPWPSEQGTMRQLYLTVMKVQVEIVLGLGAIRVAEEEAGRVGKVAAPDVGFEAVEVFGGDLNRHAVELLGAALLPIKLLHPAVQVGVLAPVEELAGFRHLEVHRLLGGFTGHIGIHVESHFLLLSLVSFVPKDANPKGSAHEAQPSWPTRLEEVGRAGH